MKTFYLCLVMMLSGSYFVVGQGSQSEILKPVETQLTAYNNRDIEAFLKPYSDSVKVFGFPQQPQYVGKTAMRQVYTDMFAYLPDLHCKVVNRIQSGNTIIDHEKVILRKSEPTLEAVAIYKVKNSEITEVYFIFPER